jgi:hypothetical protein
MQNPSLPFRAEREGPAAEPWEGEVGASASALESPTSPQPSPPRPSDSSGRRGSCHVPPRIPRASVVKSLLLTASLVNKKEAR